MSDRQLSLNATGKPDALRSIRRGVKDGSQHGVNSRTLAAFAKTLHTTERWLLNEEGPEDIQSPIGVHIESSQIAASNGNGTRERIVPIKGYVGAGSEAHFYKTSDEFFEKAPAIEHCNDQTVAVEIRGDSFGPLMDGWLVYYDDVRSPITEDLFGKTCVVGLADDRILLKKIKRERDGTFTLLSNSNEPPIRNVELEWAAEVVGFRQR